MEDNNSIHSAKELYSLHANEIINDLLASANMLMLVYYPKTHEYEMLSLPKVFSFIPVKGTGFPANFISNFNMSDEHRNVLKDCVRNIDNGQKNSSGTIRINVNGHNTWVTFRFTLFSDDRGKPDYALGYAYNTTKSKEMEEDFAKQEIERQSLKGVIIAASCFNVTQDRTIKHDLGRGGFVCEDIIDPEIIESIREADASSSDQSMDTKAILYSTASQIPDPKERADFVQMCSRTGLQKAFREGKMEQTLDYHRMIDGKLVWVSTRVVLVRQPETRDIFAFFFTKDITADKEKDRQLRDALAAAEQSNLAKSEFLSRMSHDIRTPMNAIIGYATLMQRDYADPDKVREEANKILSSSNHLLGLINDVLDMSKIESGKVEVNERPFKLSEMIDMIDSIIRPQTDAKNQKFDIYVTSIRHDNFIADDNRIQQILINILSNSVKYTGEGGKIALRVKPITDSLANYESISFEISDNGRGMSKAFQEEIFEPFSREARTGSDSMQGTGLGMAITKNLVNILGGTISVKSWIREGSVFTVILPLKVPGDDSDSVFWESHSSHRMLVVDGDDEICLNVRNIMEDTGVTVDVSNNGKDAIDRVSSAIASRRPYSIIMLDWKLPGKSGADTARDIRQIAGEDVIIVILSAIDVSQIEKDAKSAGATGFLKKPFFRQGLQQIIEKHEIKLAKSREAGGGAQSQGTELFEAEDRSGNVLNGLNILAVEDNELNAEILSEILKINGANVTLSGNGRDAYDKFRFAATGTFDLIFMDLQMPVMNGYESTKAIRDIANDFAIDANKRNEASTIPIVAMTANAFSEDIQKSLISGMNAHIAKPIDINVIKKTVKKVLRRRRK